MTNVENLDIADIKAGLAAGTMIVWMYARPTSLKRVIFPLRG